MTTLTVDTATTNTPENLVGNQTSSRIAAAQAGEKKFLLNTYDRHPILMVRGDGVHLYDDSGIEYLDLLSGIGVCGLGYNHPAINHAIADQAPKLLHTSNLFYTEHTVPLAQKLTEISGMDRVFFTNSGTEAWEAALKLARAHAGLLRSEGKHIGTGVIAMTHSFHGRTMGSVATTEKQKYREPFQPVMPGVTFVPFNDVAALRSTFSAETCAIALECLQGEGGIHPVSEEFLQAARELCDATGALLLADEIQSGMGRTGKWFAYQHYGIRPDVVTLAKPVAGGLPMGAMLCTEVASRAMTPGMHGTTFGGGPLVTAVALAVIKEIESAALLAHVEEVSAYFFDKLRALAAEHSTVAEVRGRGLMIGVEMKDAEHAAEVAKRLLMEEHVILNRTSDTVLRMLPPFVMTKSDVDRAVSAMERVLNATSGPIPAEASAATGDDEDGK